jgi:hypothetical protein
MVSAAEWWIRESPAARATSLMYTEKRVCPRIEPCGTPIETARGPDNRPSDVEVLLTFCYTQGSLIKETHISIGFHLNKGLIKSLNQKTPKYCSLT